MEKEYELWGKIKKQGTENGGLPPQNGVGFDIHRGRGEEGRVEWSELFELVLK